MPHRPILLNCFPKSGTHLIAQMVRPLAEPARGFASLPGQPAERYLSIFENGGWGPAVRPLEKVMQDLHHVEDGSMVAGHLAASVPVLQWIRKQGWAVIFLHRDLRDVAISEAYHAANPDDSRWRHPFKRMFQKLPTHEDRVRAVITGLEGYTSLRERWEQYAYWLAQDWVLPIQYRDLVINPVTSCLAILGYLRKRTGMNWSSELVSYMIDSVSPEASPTFRRGKPGGWKDEMGPSLRALAEKKLGDWLDALGFNEPLERTDERFLERLRKATGDEWIDDYRSRYLYSSRVSFAFRADDSSAAGQGV